MTPPRSLCREEALKKAANLGVAGRLAIGDVGRSATTAM
jgi:hypothetical protein